MHIEISQSGVWSNFSHTIFFVCVNFINFILLAVNYELRIFEKLYRGNFIYYQSSRQKKVSGEIFFNLSWGLNRKLTSSKPAN